MRILYPLVLFVILAAVGITLFKSNSETDPLTTEREFIKTVEAGDYRNAVELFGGNACNCPKKGGWVSYLIYSSAQEPNLAFLMGQSFSHGGEKVRPIESKAKETAVGNILPWQTPEDVVVDVDLKFNKGYEPLFLPLKMAYGHEMTKQEFDDFTRNPDQDAWKGFTLRLRKSIRPGVTARPQKSKGIEYRPDEEKPDEINRKQSVNRETISEGEEGDASSSKSVEPSDESYVYKGLEDDIVEALGEEAALYLRPSDAGDVIDKDTGEKVSMESVKAALPRLQSAKLRLHIVRRGKLNNKWTVYHLGLVEPVVALADGSMKELKTVKPPTFKKLKRDADTETRKSGEDRTRDKTKQ